MKAKFFMIAVLAAAVGFASCAKDDGEGKNAEDNSVSLNIKLSNDVVNTTRTMDDIDAVDKTKQDKVNLVSGELINVFMFKSDGTKVIAEAIDVADLLTGKTYTNAAYTTLTTSTDKVVIVGNIGDITSGVNSYSDLQAKLKTLADAETDYNDAARGKIWVYGDKTITWLGDTDNDGVIEGETKITLNPILSRIDLTVDITGVTKGIAGVGDNPAYPNVEITGVAVLYSGAQTHLAKNFPYLMSEKGANKAFTSSIVAASYTAWNSQLHGDAATYDPNSGADNFLHATWKGTWNSQPNFATNVFTRSFYAFAPDETADTANQGYTANTIITVYGDRIEYEADGTTVKSRTTYFWPVHFNANNASIGAESLQPGQRYAVKISLIGDFSIPKPGGPHPEDQFPANVKVEIEKPAWKPVISVNKNFTNP